MPAFHHLPPVFQIVAVLLFALLVVQSVAGPFAAYASFRTFHSCGFAFSRHHYAREATTYAFTTVASFAGAVLLVGYFIG